MTIMNRTATAAALGIAKTTLDSWVAEGAPVVSREGRKGVETQYDTAEVLRWWMAREAAKAERGADPKDLDALKAEKIRVETESKRLALQKERGEVADVAQLEREYVAVVIHVRNQLLALPGRLAPLLIGETDETRMKSAINDEVRQALTELSAENMEKIIEGAAQW